jgi:hypothetical protein
MKKKLVHVVIDLDENVRLFRTGKDRFTVEYGEQVTKGLTYSEAALEYGLCIMHSAACVGKLDN